MAYLNGISTTATVPSREDDGARLGGIDIRAFDAGGNVNAAMVPTKGLHKMRRCASGWLIRIDELIVRGIALPGGVIRWAGAASPEGSAFVLPASAEKLKPSVEGTSPYGMA